MAAPIGNNFAVGNSGGGRKSAYQEQADAELLASMFLEEMSKEDIAKKLATGKYSLKDVFISKGFSGNEGVLREIFRKLFPDIVKSETKAEIKVSFEGDGFYIHSAQNTEGGNAVPSKV